jgi:ferredoxin-type protein NapH
MVEKSVSGIMKQLKYIGLSIFFVGLLIFTIAPFLGKFQITDKAATAYFDNTPEEVDKGDTLSASFVEAYELYASENSSSMSGLFAFNAHLPSIIQRQHEVVSEPFKAKDGITSEEQDALLTRVEQNGDIEYSQQILNETLAPEKAGKLGDLTSWMFTDQKTYADIETFKNDLIPKLDEINASAGKEYFISTDSWQILELNKAFIESPIKQNKGLWFFLTFGVIAIGVVLYNVANFKLLGPAGIKNNGTYHNSAMNRGWVGMIAFGYLVTFYIVLYFYPHYLTNSILIVDPVSEGLSRNPASQWFLYGFIYCVAMTLMAIRMYIKYRHNAYQMVRTTVVLFFQIAFAFIIPEILVRFNMPYYDFKNAWPLDYDFFFAWNLDSLQSSGAIGMFMLFWGIILTIIIVPIMTYFYGKRWYCSWVCGCGGLAETVGDPYRHLSNKKLWAWKLERWLIHSVLVFAIIMTAITLYSYFSGAYSVLGVQTYSIQKVYGFLIGSIFAGVIGTGFYPVLGNRSWCRFGCPLAAYMGLVQRFKSRFRITTNGGQCISCGNCSTYCEQGIDVRAYAQKGQNIVRSSCVGCGVCAAVCPRGVLKLENGPEDGRFGNEGPIVLGNDGFKLNQ